LHDVFESHSLRQFSNRSQKCGFRELFNIFERFLLLKIVNIPGQQTQIHRERQFLLARPADRAPTSGGIGAVEQEDRNRLIGLPANIHGPVNTVGWLFPVNLPRRNLAPKALSSIPVLD
jgi:hypothetical protein